MNRADFAQLALDRIRNLQTHAASIFDEARFSVVTTKADGTQFVTGLSNYYDEYVQLPEDARDTVLARIVKACGYVEGGEGLDEVRVMLMPRIRARRYFEVDLLQAVGAFGDAAAKNAQSHYRPLAEHLGVAVAIDRPEHIEYVSDPGKYGLPIPEIEEIARINLKRATKSGLQQVAPGVWVGAWGDDYAPERMLLPELFTELKLDGDPVVFVPGSEQIIVASSADPISLGHVLALVDERLARPRSLVGFAFVLRNGAWQLFEPQGDIGKELGRRLALHLSDAYAFQREVLQARYGDAEGAPFIPNVMAAGSDGQVAFTITTWGAGVHALLPRTMIVGVGRLETGETAMVPWQDVMAIAGQHLVKRDDLYPPRWETKGFPDDAAFAKLQALGGARGAGNARVPSPDVDLPRGTSTGFGKLGTVLLIVALAVAVYLLLLRGG